MIVDRKVKSCDQKQRVPSWDQEFLWQEFLLFLHTLPVFDFRDWINFLKYWPFVLRVLVQDTVAIVMHRFYNSTFRKRDPIGTPVSQKNDTTINEIREGVKTRPRNPWHVGPLKVTLFKGKEYYPIPMDPWRGMAGSSDNDRRWETICERMRNYE